MLSRAIMAVLFLASLSAASACVENFADVMSGDLGVNIVLAFTLATMVVAIIYAIGTTTGNANMIVLSKDELYHLLFSIALLVALGGLLNLSCLIFSGFLDFALGLEKDGAKVFPGIEASVCYNGVESPQTISRCFMNRIESDARQMVERLIKKSIDEEMESTFVVSIYNPFTGGTTLPFTAYRRTYSAQLDLIAMSFVMPALTSISVQKLLINFSLDIVTWLLPIAFFFRVLPPTRQMGNALIAVSIALYVLMPVLYSLSGAMDAVVFTDSECAAFANAVNDRVMGDCASPLSFWKVARLMPQAFFLPNLNLALTITFLGGINKALKVIT